jgi:hypothetical protein
MMFHNADSKMPELANLNESELRIVVHTARELLKKEKPFSRLIDAWPIFVGCFLGMFPGTTFSHLYRGADGSLLVMGIGGMLGGMIGSIITAQLQARRLRPYLRRVIQGRWDDVR